LTLLQFADYAVEVLNLAGVVLIWLPAYKAVRTLQAISKLKNFKERNQGEIADVAANASVMLANEMATFNLRDSVCLMLGLTLALVASLVKIFYVLPVSHG
jgi:hypothetical protein